MRADQCRFCSSRRCRYRIYAVGWDEVACSKHGTQLEIVADLEVTATKLHHSGMSLKRRNPADTTPAGFAARVAECRAKAPVEAPRV